MGDTIPHVRISGRHAVSGTISRMDDSMPQVDSAGEVALRPYVPPTLEHHENWQIVTGQPISPAN